MIASNPFKKRLQYLIHIIIWGVVIIFPLVFLYSEGERNPVRYLDFTLPVFFLITVYYTNATLFIPKFLFNRRIWQFFLANLLLFTVCIFLMDSIKQLYFEDLFKGMKMDGHRPPPSKIKEILFFRDVLSMTFTVGLAVAIKMTTQWYQSQAEQREMEKLHIESELNNLKHQLNPHFLFNTLNNIYSLIGINQDHAQQAVHRLSNLIRYVLYESDRSKVPVSKDLSFTANYIELMGLRLPAHASLDNKIDDAPADLLIAPLLFISLVENAFKHGVHPTEPSFINIRLRFPAEGEISCLVENSNFPKTEADRSGSGIGLQNLRKRLELIYPGAYTLTAEVSGNTYKTSLIIRL